jgi:hypothetical protein
MNGLIGWLTQGLRVAKLGMLALCGGCLLLAMVPWMAESEGRGQSAEAAVRLARWEGEPALDTADRAKLGDRYTIGAVTGHPLSQGCPNIHICKTGSVISGFCWTKHAMPWLPECLQGPDVPVSPACLSRFNSAENRTECAHTIADVCDEDIDLRDVAQFFRVRGAVHPLRYAMTRRALG